MAVNFVVPEVNPFLSSLYFTAIFNFRKFIYFAFSPHFSCSFDLQTLGSD